MTTDHVYGISQVAGSSDRSIEEAIDNAITTAAGTVRNLNWFEVTEIRGHIEGGKVGHYQVALKLGFRYNR